MFEKREYFRKLTDRATSVLSMSYQEACRFHHEYVGTEHILLGLVAEGTGVAASGLKNLSVDRFQIRQEVEHRILRGANAVLQDDISLTPRAKKVIEHAEEEAHNLNHNYIGTEHLLLGLIREQGTVASLILMHFGLTAELIRGEVVKLLGKP